MITSQRWFCDPNWNDLVKRALASASKSILENNFNPYRPEQEMNVYPSEEA
jgi:hypothetical protein